MGLDIYAGTLTRYYSQNWKTVAQQAAEASGMGYQVIRANEEEDIITDPAVIQLDMKQWSEVVSAALVMEDGQAQKPWVEDNEKPYYTNKPDWCAFGVLQLYGACRQYGLPIPKTVPRNWDPYKDETILRAMNDPELNWSLYSSAEWWLPYEACFIFHGCTPADTEITFGTTGLLLAELDVINQKSWNASREEILGWENTEGYPEDGHMENGVFIRKTENSDFSVESLARFAFSILYRAALFSLEYGVPIILDY